eukprot:12932730-Prorocentrum_lima.AAC.1
MPPQRDLCLEERVRHKCATYVQPVFGQTSPTPGWSLLSVPFEILHHGPAIGLPLMLSKTA